MKQAAEPAEAAVAEARVGFLLEQLLPAPSPVTPQRSLRSADLAARLMMLLFSVRPSRNSIER